MGLVATDKPNKNVNGRGAEEDPGSLEWYTLNDRFLQTDSPETSYYTLIAVVRAQNAQNMRPYSRAERTKSPVTLSELEAVGSLANIEDIGSLAGLI